MYFMALWWCVGTKDLLNLLQQIARIDPSLSSCCRFLFSPWHWCQTGVHPSLPPPETPCCCRHQDQCSLSPASSQRLRSNRSTFISDPVVTTSSIELPHSTEEDIVLQWGDTGFLISSSDFIDKLKVHSAPIQRPRYIYTALQTMQFENFYSYSSTSKKYWKSVYNRWL